MEKQPGGKMRGGVVELEKPGMGVWPRSAHSRNRRGILGVLLLAALLLAVVGPKCGLERLRKGEQPTLLYVIPVAAMSSAERVMIATLQGIAANAGGEQIYIHPEAGGYETWLQDLQDTYGVGRIDVVDPWWLVSHFQPQLAGYLLYQAGNDSVNAATSLAGLERAIVVEASIEAQAIAQGLSRVLDMRNLDEAWVLANHGARLNFVTAFEQKESFEHSLRDYAVMSRALTFYDGNSAFRDSVMAWLREDSALLGWGDASGGEDQFIRASSARGVFTLPADHAHNLAPLSGMPTVQQTQVARVPPALESGVHYAAFLMTDGDNVQFALGNLQSDTRWFGSPLRGNFDMGWGFPPGLVRLAPSVMRWYYENAAQGPGRDSFVVGPSGSGYLYPSLYPREDLEINVAQLAEWMALGDLKVVEILDFYSLTNTSLWDVYTAKPEIEGLIYLEYGDHSLPAGAVVWSNGKPVVSPRVKLWRGLPGSDEATITQLINNAPRDASSPLGYSLVIVGIWEHSLADIQGIIDALGSDVRVVTPEALIQLMTENIPHDVNIDHDYTGEDFETAEMVLVGDAFWTSDYDPLFSPHPDRLRITANAGGLLGSAWWNGTIDPARSWSTVFRFQFSYPAVGGADGLGFHIQGDGLLANPGHEGGSLVNPHLSIVLDTWNNGPEGSDESLKVILNGMQIYLNDLLDFGPDPNPGASPTVFRMELTYVAAGPELAIRFFDEGGTDALYDTVLGVDLSAFGSSYVGFSGTTGASTENHDVRSWILDAAAP
jgi:hypothetical protein